MTIWAILALALISIAGKSFGYALSLAGVAGLVISLGVTADSYIVFFERLKDEVRAGRSPRAAVQPAFKRAFKTIVAADIVTGIAAAVLVPHGGELGPRVRADARCRDRPRPVRRLLLQAPDRVPDRARPRRLVEHARLRLDVGDGGRPHRARHNGGARRMNVPGRLRRLPGHTGSPRSSWSSTATGGSRSPAS